MRRWYLLAAALALVLALAGGGAAVAQQGQARLRVVHAVPDAPPVDVLVDGTVVFRAVPYKGITPYTPLSAGTHQVRVVPAGQEQTVLIDTTVDLLANSDHTFLAVGTLANVQPLALVDDNTLPPAGQAKVRFVHASPNTPPVDVAVSGGPVLFANVPFTGVGNYVTINAGTVNLEVLAASVGTATPSAPGNVLLAVPNVTFNQRTVYTVYAVGLLNAQPPLEALVSVDAAPAAVGVTATAAFTPTPLTRTPTPTPSQTPSPTPSPTPSATPTATGVASPTATGVASPTATGVASPTATGVASPTATGVASPTATGVASPTATGVASPSPTTAVSPTPLGGASPSPAAATATGAPASPTFASPTP